MALRAFINNMILEFDATPLFRVSMTIVDEEAFSSNHDTILVSFDGSDLAVQINGKISDAVIARINEMYAPGTPLGGLLGQVITKNQLLMHRVDKGL